MIWPKFQQNTIYINPMILEHKKAPSEVQLKNNIKQLEHNLNIKGQYLNITEYDSTRLELNLNTKKNDLNIIRT